MKLTIQNRKLKENAEIGNLNLVKEALMEGANIHIQNDYPLLIV